MMRRSRLGVFAALTLLGGCASQPGGEGLGASEILRIAGYFCALVLSVVICRIILNSNED